MGFSDKLKGLLITMAARADRRAVPIQTACKKWAMKA